jgi:hypothetical protein
VFGLEVSVPIAKKIKKSCRPRPPTLKLLGENNFLLNHLYNAVCEKLFDKSQ